MDQVYLINQATFLPYQDISANIKPARLNTFIKKAQDLDLRLLLGEPMFYDLLSKCNGDSSLKPEAPAQYLALLKGTTYTNKQGQQINYEGLIPALVYWTLARFVESDNIRYTTNGPVLKNHDNGSGLTYADIISTAQQYRTTANAYANNIEKYLIATREDYPLWIYDERARRARQPGPRIRAIDKTAFNYPADELNYNYLQLTDG